MGYRQAHAAKADPNFPFIIAALAPEGGAASPVIRYSQWGVASAAFAGGHGAGAGTATGVPIIPNVGIANLIDLYDAGSPCGSVHIRNKTTVGERLAQAALALDYNVSAGSADWNGPVPASIVLDHGALTIKYTRAGGRAAAALGFVTLTWNNQTLDTEFQGFEVIFGDSPILVY